MVRNEFDVCNARNGAHRNDPEMSLTYRNMEKGVKREK